MIKVKNLSMKVMQHPKNVPDPWNAIHSGTKYLKLHVVLLLKFAYRTVDGWL